MKCHYCGRSKEEPRTLFEGRYPDIQSSLETETHTVRAVYKGGFKEMTSDEIRLNLMPKTINSEHFAFSMNVSNLLLGGLSRREGVYLCSRFPICCEMFKVTTCAVNSKPHGSYDRGGGG